MGLLSVLPLDACPDGVPVLLGAGATTLHTASLTAGVQDKVSLWAANVSAIDTTLTLTCGGVLLLFELAILARSSRFMYLDRKLMQNGAVLEATPGDADCLSLDGDATRSTP